MENWTDVLGYEGYYEVSNIGNVRRIGAKKQLKPINNGFDYMSVCLCVKSKAQRHYIHRVVAQSFLPNPYNKPEVNHIDGNRQNNALYNLEWVTRSENHKHRYDVLNQRGVNYGKTGALNWRSKPVAQMDINGKIIKIHPAVMEAQRFTGIGESNIRCAIYGEQTHAGGYKWKYV